MERLTIGLTAGPMQRASYGTMHKAALNSNRGSNGLFFSRYDCGGANTNGPRFLMHTPGYAPTETLSLPPIVSPASRISSPGSSMALSQSKLPAALPSQPFGTMSSLASFGIKATSTRSINHRRQHAFGQHIARTTTSRSTPRTTSLRGSRDEANAVYPVFSSSLDFPAPEHTWPPRTAWLQF